MTRIAPYPLRMPPEMRSELEKVSDESRRSLQQEIIYRLYSYESIRTLLRNLPIKGDPYDQVLALLKAYTQVEKQADEIGELKKGCPHWLSQQNHQILIDLLKLNSRLKT